MFVRQQFTRSRRAAIALVTGLALVAAGCSDGASGDSAGSGKTLKIFSLTGSQQQALTDLAKQFQTANPGTSITTEFIDPGTYPQTLLTRLRSGAGPDVFYANGGAGQAYSLAPLSKSQQILDLSSQSWAGNLPEAAKDLYTIDGKVYGLPLALVPVGLAYNTGEFEKLGLVVPTTMDQLLQDCTKATAAGTSVLSVAGAAAPNAGVFAQMIAASSVYSADPDWNTKRAEGSVTFAGSPEWQTALQRIIDLKDGGCLLPGSEGTSISAMFNAVGQARALSLPGPTGVIQAVQEVDPSVKMDLAPFPGTTADDTRAMVGYSDALAVNAKTDSEALAVKFLDFMATPENAKTYAEAGGTVSIADAAAGDLPAEAQGFSSYVKDGRTASLPNLAWINGDTYAALTSGVQGLLTGQQKPADVLKAMDAAWDKGAAS